MSFNKAVILAGGLGTRMLPLTKYVPKPLVEVEGVPIIQHVIDFLKSNRVDSIFVTYGYKAPLLFNYVNDKVSTLINTIDQDNSYFIFNTCIKDINEPIIICPCDLIVDVELDLLYDEYVKLGEPAVCIVPMFAADNADYIHAQDGKITKITRSEKSSVCASGIQILNPYKINQLVKPTNNFYELWSALILKKSVHASAIKPKCWKSFDNIQDIIQ